MFHFPLYISTSTEINFLRNLSLLRSNKINADKKGNYIFYLWNRQLQVTLVLLTANQGRKIVSCLEFSLSFY